MIGTNKKDATDTVARILEDREAGTLNEPKDADPENVEKFLAEVCPSVVTWEGWRSIDVHETGLGEPQGRPRVKLVRTGEDARRRLRVAEPVVARRGRGAGPRHGSGPHPRSPRSA